MAKSRDAFRTISEVSDWLETPAHVLRFWESRFTQIKPVKRAGGRRYYRPVDMELLGGIKRLLHDDGITIKGVQKILREKGVKYVAGLSLEPPADQDDTDTSPKQPEETPVEALLAEDTPDTRGAPGPLRADPDMVAPGSDWSTSDPADDNDPVLAEYADDGTAYETISPVLETAEPPADRFVAPRPTLDAPAPADRNEPSLDALYTRLAALRDRLRAEAASD